MIREHPEGGPFSSSGLEGAGPPKTARTLSPRPALGLPTPGPRAEGNK